MGIVFIRVGLLDFMLEPLKVFVSEFLARCNIVITHMSQVDYEPFKDTFAEISNYIYSSLMIIVEYTHLWKIYLYELEFTSSMTSLLDFESMYTTLSSLSLSDYV
jgi:hypothetical protein